MAVTPETLVRHNLGIAEDLASEIHEPTTLGYIRASIAALNDGLLLECGNWIALAHNITRSQMLRVDLEKAMSALSDMRIA